TSTSPSPRPAASSATTRASPSPTASPRPWRGTRALPTEPLSPVLMLQGISVFSLTQHFLAPTLNTLSLENPPKRYRHFREVTHAAQQPTTSPGLHAHRTVGGHRHHRHLDCPARPGGAESPPGGAADADVGSPGPIGQSKPQRPRHLQGVPIARVLPRQER